jgi:hypothetical protein
MFPTVSSFAEYNISLVADHGGGAGQDGSIPATPFLMHRGMKFSTILAVVIATLCRWVPTPTPGMNGRAEQDVIVAHLRRLYA